ncbi:MAG: RHS repeat-associated core domain-containing protein, partial [Gammaproteobacteria bacterium]|nr:RHS repeat-associated core domain-containing protein [Gammaproteobacteria bacterium]
YGETYYTYRKNGDSSFPQQTGYRYTGQRQEPDIGLYDYRARWYDPSLGRFLQPDTIVPEPGDPQNFNRYSYVGNNPIRYSDPTGSCIPEECPGVPDVPHPGEATGLRGEEYAAYLINYILWVDRERAATGGVVPYTYQSNQIGAATALNSFLMDDPEYLGEVFYQQLLMATPQLATMA